MSSAQQSSKKVPSTAHWNKNRDPQPENMQRMRDRGTLSLKQMYLSNPSTQASGDSVEEGAERAEEPEALEDTQEPRPSRHSMAGEHKHS